jgi:hypothetical protein
MSYARTADRAGATREGDLTTKLVLQGEDQMLLFIVLAVLLPWSIWRQMHPHTVTRQSLMKLPVLFAGIGVLVQIGSPLPDGRAAALALTISVAASALLGVWRGAVIPVWRTQNGSWMSQGNRTTIALWVVLIAFKFALGTVGTVTGLFPVETVGEVFVTLGLSFAVQNLVVARRSIAQMIRPERTTA